MQTYPLMCVYNFQFQHPTHVWMYPMNQKPHECHQTKIFKNISKLQLLFNLNFLLPAKNKLDLCDLVTYANIPVFLDAKF